MTIDEFFTKYGQDLRPAASSGALHLEFLGVTFRVCPPEDLHDYWSIFGKGVRTPVGRGYLLSDFHVYRITSSTPWGTRKWEGVTIRVSATDLSSRVGHSFR